MRKYTALLTLVFTIILGGNCKLFAYYDWNKNYDVITFAYKSMKSVSWSKRYIYTYQMFELGDQLYYADIYNNSEYEPINKKLLIQLSNSKTDYTKAESYANLADHNRYYAPDSTIKYAKDGINIAKRNGYLSLLALLYEALGQAYINKYQYDLSVENYATSMEYYQMKMDYHNIIRIDFHLAQVHIRFSNFQDAIICYEHAIKTSRNKKIQIPIIDYMLNSLSHLYKVLGKHDEAIKNYLSILSDTTTDLWEVRSVYTAIGDCYRLQQDYYKAYKYYDRAIKHNSDIRSRLDVMLGIAVTYLDIIDKKEVKNFVKHFALDSNKMLALSGKYLQLSLKHLQDTKQWISKYIEQDYSISDMVTASGELNKMKEISAIETLYQYLSKYYRLINNIDSSQKYEDKLVEARHYGTILRYKLNHQYKSFMESREKILESKKQESEKSQSDMYVSISIAVVLAILVFGLIILFRNKRKAHKQLQEQAKQIADANLELEALSQDLAQKNQEVEQSNLDLAALNDTKTKLFSIISHDLKGPVYSFNNLSQFLSEYYYKFTDEEKKQHIDTLKISSGNVAKLLENLLSWARLQTENMRICTEKINISELLNKESELHTQAISEKNIKLQNSAHHKINVFSDAETLSTVVRNLLSNAIKFTPDGGKIAIAATEAKDFVEISIADNGIGIKEEDKNKIFNVGIKHSTIGTNNEKGTGLGLNLCKEFLDKINGSIRFESELGKGTTFYVRLPKEETEII